MVKKAYSVETELACIDMKKAGKSNKVIMETLGIKNKSQIGCSALDSKGFSIVLKANYDYF